MLAVSYTHLIWHSTKEATITTISGAPSANCNSLPVIKAISVTTGTVSEMVANTAVSYTHLDVYKRQVLPTGNRFRKISKPHR